MSARDQIDRSYEREQQALDDMLDRGDITAEEHRRQSRELERQARDEYREAEEREVDAVREDWR